MPEGVSVGPLAGNTAGSMGFTSSSSVQAKANKLTKSDKDKIFKIFMINSI